MDAHTEPAVIVADAQVAKSRVWGARESLGYDGFKEVKGVAAASPPTSAGRSWRACAAQPTTTSPAGSSVDFPFSDSPKLEVKVVQGVPVACEPEGEPATGTRAAAT